MCCVLLCICAYRKGQQSLSPLLSMPSVKTIPGKAVVKWFPSCISTSQEKGEVCPQCSIGRIQ